MADTRTRKLRRREKQYLKHGAKPQHKVVAGRTGGTHAKKLKSRNTVRRNPSDDALR